LSILPIRIYPDPVLRVRCSEITEFNAELRKLAADMAQTMYDAPGLGLAAPQVGVEKRIAVVDVVASADSAGSDTSGSPGELYVLVNPEIVGRDGSDVETEGCLSIPGVTEKVVRPSSIVVRAQGLDGADFELEAQGLLARAICHEVDHLDGVLFFEHLNGLRRQRVARQLRRLKQESEQESVVTA